MDTTTPLPSNPVPGPWRFKVYGEYVTGTQLYVLNYF